MGVKNLWDILESCKKTLPLHHLQNKRVCIDLSCWIVQFHNVNKSHCSLKDKVYLSSLFHRLRALIALNCSLIFVTDGSIPAIKMATYRRRLGSGSEVVRDETITHKMPSLRRNMGSEFSCMIKEAKVLGNALGIPCLDGIEEAEAQCALLNSESFCDGCFSADSDIFLFGAKTVYRDIDLGEGGHVVCYEMADIEKKLGFGRNSLIALALLLGGDYSHGVHGLGQETACQIVKSIGNNNVLQRVASEGLAFAKKSKGSKKQVKVLKGDANEENCLGHKQKNIENGLDPSEHDQFLQVMNAYLKPKCHSPDSEAVHRVLIHYPFQRAKLQQICEQFFGWTPEKTDEYILPKIAERDLRRFSNLRSSSSKLGVLLPLYQIPVTCPISEIIKPRKVQGRESFEVAWKEFEDLKSSIVPADLIESACPEKIVEYEERKAQGKKQKQNFRARPKKPEDQALVDEAERKLQSLLLEIELENDAGSNAGIHHNPGIHDSNAIPENKAAVDEAERNLQKLLVIESENNGVSNAAFRCNHPVDNNNNAIPENRATVDEAEQQLQCLLREMESQKNSDSNAAIPHNPAVCSCDAIPEVIDLLSPSPQIPACKISKFQDYIYKQIAVIDLCDSETEKSSGQAKERDPRSFARITIDIS